MVGRSKELEDFGRVASSFPTYLGKIEVTLLAGYMRCGLSTKSLSKVVFVDIKFAKNQNCFIQGSNLMLLSLDASTRHVF